MSKQLFQDYLTSHSLILTTLQARKVPKRSPLPQKSLPKKVRNLIHTLHYCLPTFQACKGFEIDE